MHFAGSVANGNDKQQTSRLPVVRGEPNSVPILAERLSIRQYILVSSSRIAVSRS